jgi:hypothetical protein
MRKLTTLLAFVALAIPAVVAAGNGQGQSAAENTCKAQRQSMGEANFRSVYAPNGSAKDAMDKCVAAQGTQAAAAAKNAAKECKAERASMGAGPFAEKYGKNANDKNAFGKCVSEKAKAKAAAANQATMAAAKTCKAERTQLGASDFAKKYGNAKNAFGKCVSKLKHAAAPTG